MATPIAGVRIQYKELKVGNSIVSSLLSWMGGIQYKELKGREGVSVHGVYYELGIQYKELKATGSCGALETSLT